jgi:4-amino-4-deoxy-L-arabinose transferase-like glycosyltransferase
MVVASVATVLLTYRIGCRLVGRDAAFVGAWLFGMFYVPLFYGTRILTEIPHLALCLLGLHLFLVRRPLATTLSVPVLTFAVFTRFTAGLMLVVLALYVTVSEGIAALRRREYWLGAVLGMLVAVPFAVPFLQAWEASQYMMPGRDLAERIHSLWQNAAWMGRSFGWVLTALWAGGVVLLLARVIRQGSTGPADQTNPRREGLVVLWLMVPMLYFGLMVPWNVSSDRYLILALPSAFLAIGYCTVRLGSLAAWGHAGVTAVVMLVVVGLGTLRFLPDADNRIRSRVTSYDGLRDAGLWIKERTGPEDIVLSRSVAQLTYYSTRRGESIPDERPAFDAMMKTLTPRYVVISGYEEHPTWILDTSAESLGLRTIEGFPEGRPVAVILEPALLP